MTIPATVPLASRLLCNGAGATAVGCLVGLLLVKVLGLVLLGVWTGEESSPAVDMDFGATEVTEAGVTEPGRTEVVVDVGKLVELLPTSKDAELSAEVALGALLPEAVRATYPPNWVAVGGPSVGKYIKEKMAVGVPAGPN